jgi:hypothetical protein
METCEVGVDGEGDGVPLWLEVGFLVDRGAIDGRIHSISKLEERWEGFKKLLVFLVEQEDVGVHFVAVVDLWGSAEGGS